MNAINAIKAKSAKHYALLLALPLLVVPLLQRLALWGSESAYGVLSDLLAGGILFLLAYRLPALALACVLALWTITCGANLELVAAVGRMPGLSDLQYLTDPTFVENSTGGGLSHPVFALMMALTGSAAVLARSMLETGALTRLPRTLWLAPLTLWTVHQAGQFFLPSAAEPWKQFSLAHKLTGEALARFDLIESTIANDKALRQSVDVSGLAKQDLSGKRLIGNGKAKNVLIITMEGIPGAYIAGTRQAAGYNWDKDPMPKLSAFAQNAMQSRDYVLHSHQTIRGLYAMLCGDFSKLDSGTPKGVELLALSERNKQCLPAQMNQHGFSTHFLQGAGLVFMSKDKIMPHMGFQQTRGREWFKRKPYYEFAWGMDDKSFFEGAFDYVKELRKTPDKPWMLTLLTVGTHQPYAASAAYVKKYGSAKMASVAYLDEAVTAFLEKLKASGAMEDTLVIVTSDESHNVEELRLASAWGLNLVFAPESSELPKIKNGVYGHVDLTASVLDYFGYALPKDIGGRSLFRDYDTPREMISFTNGFLRYLDRNGNFQECDFQNVCREYKQGGHFIQPQAALARQYSGADARRVAVRAQILDQSLTAHQAAQTYQFANGDRRKLKRKVNNEWTDNLIGAQYMEFGAGTRTTVRLKVKALNTDKQGAKLWLALKEFDHATDATAPELPIIKKGEELDISFDIDNPKGRKIFSFHLLGEGKGEIELTDFSVTTHSALEHTPL